MNPQRIGVIAFAVIGLVCLGFAGVLYQRAASWQANARHADGLVTSVEHVINPSSQEDDVRAWISFKDDSGTEHSSVMWNGKLTQGQAISIWFDPNHPSDISLGGAGWPAALLAGMGLVFVLFVLFALSVTLRRRIPSA